MSKRQQLDVGAQRRSGWDAAAKELAGRLKIKNPGVRALTGWIAQSSWRRWYYRDQPNMIDEKHDRDFPVDVLLDALALVDAARYAIDVDERDLIAAARHKGATWEAIGVALGAAESGARQTARGRYERLGGVVKAAVPGDAVEQAPTLVNAGERVDVPADDWPLPGEDRGVPGVTFTAPPALFEIDEAGER